MTVIDTFGRFVAGADLVSPSGTGSTDAGGKATLPVASGEQAISVAKAGFAEQVKLVALPAGRSSDTLLVMLIPRDAGGRHGRPSKAAAAPPGATA